LEFAAGDNIKSTAEAVQQTKNFEIGVGLDRVTHSVANLPKGVVEGAQAVAHGRRRIDIQRRTVTLSQIGQRHRIAAKCGRDLAAK
jgi:hypothetical protein